MISFDVGRDGDVKIIQVVQLYSAFVLPVRTEDQGATSWYLSHPAWRMCSFLRDPPSLSVPALLL